MNPIVLSATSGSATPVYSSPALVDLLQSPANFGLFFVGSGGSLSATVQYTGDSLYTGFTDFANSARWFDHPTMANMTGNLSGNIAFPVGAIRLKVTNGVGELTILQATEAK